MCVYHEQSIIIYIKWYSSHKNKRVITSRQSGIDKIECQSVGIDIWEFYYSHPSRHVATASELLDGVMAFFFSDYIASGDTEDGANAGSIPPIFGHHRNGVICEDKEGK